MRCVHTYRNREKEQEYARFWQRQVALNYIYIRLVVELNCLLFSLERIFSNKDPNNFDIFTAKRYTFYEKKREGKNLIRKWWYMAVKGLRCVSVTWTRKKMLLKVQQKCLRIFVTIGIDRCRRHLVESSKTSDDLTDHLNVHRPVVVAIKITFLKAATYIVIKIASENPEAST